MIVSSLILAMLAAITTNAAPMVFQSAERQASLLELYTSQGCSSCPPAEAWLGHLKDSPDLWTNFVPVAFHVDYWNHLGWRDPWSQAQFSGRQQDYAKAWGTSTIYTPEFVLNGREWNRGTWQQGVPAGSDSHAGLLKASSDDGRHWRVTFVPGKNSKSVYEVHAALLLSGTSSDVNAGENAGRRLTGDFIVIAYTTQMLTSGDGPPNAGFAFDMAKNTPPGRLALAAWITADRQAETIQAVGGWLTKSSQGK